VPGLSDPPALLGLGFALAVLGMVIRFAVRRGSRGRDAPAGARRSGRILYPGLLFSVGMAVFFGILFAGGVALLRILLGTIVVTVMALMFVTLFDLVAVAMGARRVRRWLVCAVLSFTVPLLFSMVVNNGMVALRSFDAVGVAVFGSAAALLWWSLLSAPTTNVAAVFD